MMYFTVTISVIVQNTRLMIPKTCNWSTSSL